MKRNLLIPLIIVLFIQCTNESSSEGDASQQTGEDWIALFNGSDLSDWIIKINKHELNHNFGNTFRAEDGMIKVRYDQYENFNNQFGHIYYKTPFSRYRFRLEYRFAGDSIPGVPSWAILNSGIMFHSQGLATLALNQNFPISIEFQLLAGLDDGNPRPTGNMCSPGTEIVYNGEMYPEHCLSSSSPTYDKDEWVNAELIVHADSLIIHVINGDTVLQYRKPTMGGGVVDGFDSAYWEPAKRLTSGYIALQSEGQPIDFRNIEILNLEKPTP